ncbi:MAG: glycosyltransferase family 4 protein [Chloroflexota bacterium]|nr:glycosyltransferase family 4 protein [Chloroflexota bacterium]
MVAPFGLRPKSTARVRALQLGEALVARGHRVTLLVPPWDDRSASGQTFEQGGVRVRQLRLPARPALDAPLLTFRLLREAVAARPDILHTFKPKAYSGFAALAWWTVQRSGAPVAPLVMDTDDWEGAGGWNDLAPYHPLQKRLFAWQERWGLRHADAVTAASRTLESLVLSMGVPPARVAYVPNGPGARWPEPHPADVSRLRAELALDDRPVALLFTRFFEFDPARLAGRWARVVAEHPEARLLVVGKGLMGEEEIFRNAAAAQGVAESVVEAGWQSFDALPAYFALARVALYPMDDTLVNRTKCPVKLADAMQAGLPVVGEAVGQVAEYLAGNTGGLLVPPADDDAFVAATLRLLCDSELASSLGHTATQRLTTHFDWPIQAERVETLYHTLL